MKYIPRSQTYTLMLARLSLFRPAHIVCGFSVCVCVFFFLPPLEVFMCPSLQPGGPGYLSVIGKSFET